MSSMGADRVERSLARVLGRASLLASLALLSACNSEAAPESPLPKDRSDWSLVVLLLDALPATGVGAWGYPLDVTPNLDALAEESVRFDQAYAGASYTLASVSSLFTGLSPEGHGVVGLSTNVLGARHETLAETFRGRGFATGGFSSNPHITKAGGFHQGFDEFRHYGRDKLGYHGISQALQDDSLEWWRAHEGERRLLYVHVLPPHQPYDAAEPHASMFGADKTERELGFTEYLVKADKEGTVERDSQLARDIRARYDAGVHQADEFVGSFLETLRESPGGAKTAFCVVSDHGEAFGEHGRLLHGSTVFNEMTHVPLILSWPGGQASVVEELVSTVNLAPTLCELFDMPFEHGESFLSAVWTDYQSPPVLSRTVGNAPVWSVRTEHWTFQRQSEKRIRLLYDRRNDRGETIELLAPGTNLEVEGEQVVTAKELEIHAQRLAKILRRELIEQRRLSKGIRPGRDDTHSAGVEDLGYVGDEEDQ